MSKIDKELLGTMITESVSTLRPVPLPVHMEQFGQYDPRGKSIGYPITVRGIDYIIVADLGYGLGLGVKDGSIMPWTVELIPLVFSNPT